MSEEKNQLGATIKGTLYLEVSARLCMDPTELMEKYTGRLILSADGGDYLVGKTRWWVIRVNEMVDRGIDPMGMLDGEDADTADFCELFLEDEMEWPKAVCKVCPEAMFGDLAILDRLIVNPPFCGRRVGLYCMEMTMRITGGMSLFALKPYPLQYCPSYAGNPAVARQQRNLAADRRKLIAYYGQTGFRKVPGTSFMVLDPGALNPVVKWEDGEGDVRFERAEAMEEFRLRETETERLKSKC